MVKTELKTESCTSGNLPKITEKVKVLTLKVLVTK